MPQPAENLTYDSLLEAANPAYPWTPPMSNAAVPVGNGALTYTPRLHREKAALWGVDIAFDITAPAGGIDPSEPYPVGGGELISVALGSGTPFLGGVPLTVEAGPRLARMAAYFVPPGVPLDKATHQRMTKQVVPGMTQSVVIGDARVVNAMAIAPTLGRLWSSSAGKHTHGINPDNKAMNSPDGINWHGLTTPPAGDQTWVVLEYSPELNRLVALASTGTSRCMTSDDGGVTWTVRSIATSGWRGLAWSPPLGLFVCGTNGATANIFWSTDGLTWSQADVVKPTTVGVRAICWSPELALFVTVGDVGTGQRVLTSPDGKTWTARNTPIDNPWWAVCWSPQLRLFAAVSNGGTGGRVMTSPDGINWTQRSAGNDGANFLFVCWSPEMMRFVAIASGGTGTRSVWSQDGITWTAEGNLSASTWVSVCWAAPLGLFVAVGSAGRIATSPDGINWTPRTNGPTAASANWAAVIWLNAYQRVVSVASATSVNPETLTWPIGIAAGEVWRGQVNVTAIGGAGGVSVLACDPQREIFVSPAITVTGKVLFKVTPTQVANRLGFSCLTTGSADLVAQDAAAFKETPLCAPQGLWDVHVFGVDADGVEDTAGVKYANVTVV